MSAFTRGNIVVYRVGTGTAALTNTATAVFLDEYTPGGTLVQSIALPTADNGANQTLTAVGNSGLEGLMSLSADGRALVFAGYDVAPGTAPLAATNNRVIGRVRADGVVDTSTAVSLGSGNVRGVASVDGTSFYVSTSTTGVGFGSFGGTTVTQLYDNTGGPLNVRGLGVYGGQLFESSMSGAFRIGAVGTGTPTTGGQVVANLAGDVAASAAAPGAFVFADLTDSVAGVDTLYVADSRATTGGLYKYSLVGGSWVSNGSSTLVGLTGLTGSAGSGAMTLFGTTSASIVRFLDTSGYNGALAVNAQPIAFAGSNTAFRGIAFAPSEAGVSIGTINIGPNSITRTEGEGGTTTTYTYTVSRTGSTAAAASVGYSVGATVGTTTLTGSDFAGGVLPSGTVTFQAGQATADLVVTVADDQLIEGSESFTVTLSGASAGYDVGAGTARGVILNDDFAGAFSIERTSDAAEGGDATFTVTRSGAAGGPVEIAYAVIADGTATAADFAGGVLPSGTVRFEAGQTRATITVATFDDTIVEGNETFTVRLDSASDGGTIATATATGTIVDNDALPTLTISDPSVVEGAPGGDAVLRYVVTASFAAPAGGIVFDIATADGTATAGSDYVARSITGATIAAGQTTYTFDVAVIGDTAPERGETVLVNLSNAQRANVGDAQGIGTIINDDGAPQGPQLLFQTAFDGFTAAGFAPGATTGGRLDSNVFRILGLSDAPSPAYGFTSPAIGAAANDFGRGVIQGSADPTSGGTYSPSANPALVLQPTGSDFVEGNGAIEARIQNVSGFTATSFDVMFDWAWRNSGDRASSMQLSYSSDGISFTAVPTTAFTTPGTRDATTAATFSNTTAAVAIGDVVVADGGYLYLRWNHTGSSGSGNRDEIGIDNLSVRAGVTDAPTLTFADVTVTEGNAGTSLATITLTRTSIEGSASIAYATANGVALAGSDYVAQSGTVTFAAGEATKTIQIAIIGDTRNEPNEAFFVNFTDPQGFLLPDNQARVTILNDDTGPVAIYDIQGLGHRSAYEGLTVQTSGVVTALRTTGSDRGYYLQDATGDGDTRTSDAIFVSTGAVSPTVAVGNAITLTGTVTEFTQNAANLTITRLTGTTGITVTNAAATLPTATLISTETGGYAPPTQVIDDDRLQSYDPATDGIDFYESLEGMLVTVRAPLVVSSTDGIGQTYVVANQGIGATGINSRFGITISPGDNAPEKIKIFAPGGGTFDQGDVLGDVSGILTYFGNTGGTNASYELDPIQPITVAVDRPAPSRETSTLAGDADHLTIASFNVENADPGDGAAKFQLIATEVTQALRNPDVIGLQEIQDADGAGTGTDTSGAATGQAIIDAIVAAGGPRYRYVEIAPAYGTTGGEPGGNIRNAYLYNPERVSLVEGSVRLIEDQAFTGSRRPLVATFGFNGEEVTVVNVHSTSRGGSDTLFGAIQPPAQAGDGSRTAQATAVKAYLDAVQAASPAAKLVTLGDFNGYYYETALSRLTADGKHTNLYSLLPVEERYSYLFEGYLQAFDNIIVSNNLLGGATFDVVHYNAEQPDSVRITDHDQPLARLYVPRANTAPTDLAIDTSSIAENLAAGTLVGTLAGRDAEAGALAYSLVDDAGGRFAVNAATGELTTRVALDFEATPTLAITARVTDAGGLFLDKRIVVTVVDVNPENVVGTDLGETAIGGAGNDVFTMRGGNDRVDGGAGFDTVVFGYALGQATTITRTGVHALTITGPEGTDTLVNVEALRFANGTVNLDGNDQFVDNLFYLRSNPDVLASGIDPTVHYKVFGIREGRDPNAFFSTRGYLASNPDVARAGSDALDHYRYFGGKEGRDPSAAFDGDLYLLHNPDVARTGTNPLDHYLNFGRYEGRAAYAAIGDRIGATGFDAEYYLLANPDVAGSNLSPAQHYATFGRYEGRNPNAFFDTAGYLRANPDVAAAGVDPLQHFNDSGWREGRDPSGAFDTRAYLADNPDVAAAGVNPLVHYLEHGAFELRDPHADGILAGTAMIIA